MAGFQCIAARNAVYGRHVRRLFLEPRGVRSLENDMIALCSSCFEAVKDRRLPSVTIANGLFLGDVPNTLKDLTPVEESMRIV